MIADLFAILAVAGGLAAMLSLAELAGEVLADPAERLIDAASSASSRLYSRLRGRR